MAFLSATPVAHPFHATRGRVCTNRRHEPITTPRASMKLSENVRELLVELKRNPIFLPSLVEAPLCSALEELQTSEPPEFHRPCSETAVGKACNTVADYHPLAIASARRTILIRFPGIGEPGGKLYPPFRAVACWRDLKEFSRVVGYYIAARKGFSDTGLDIMKRVYDEMDVPIDAMVVGVECLKEEFMGFCEEKQAADAVAEGFDVLLGLLDF